MHRDIGHTPTSVGAPPGLDLGDEEWLPTGPLATRIHVRVNSRHATSLAGIGREGELGGDGRRGGGRGEEEGGNGEEGEEEQRGGTGDEKVTRKKEKGKKWVQPGYI